MRETTTSAKMMDTTFLREVLEGVNESQRRASDAADRISSIANRAYGGKPYPPSEKAGESPVPVGDVQLVSMALGDLRVALNELHLEIDRISGLA